MGIVPQVAAHLNELLGTEAEAAAKAADVIQRKRKFTAPTLMSTVVLALLAKGGAAINDFVEMAMELGVKVTPKAMRNRFTPRLTRALRLLFDKAVSKVIAAPARSVALLSKFTEIDVGDSTIVTLPEELADEFPGCGGPSGSGKAALKLQVELSQIDGRMTRLWGKLIGVVIQHWILLASAWKEVRHSLRKGAQLIRRRVLPIAKTLTDLDRLTETLDDIADQTEHQAKIERRKQTPRLVPTP